MTRWLTTEEQQAWRAWLAASALLNDRLSRDLQAKHGLTLADYEILVWLSEHPERRLRMSELAERTLASRSRLSHQIDRMERSGLVQRQQCDDDRRGAFAVLTEFGMKAIAAAAPDHVDSVRENLVDVLSPQEFTALGDACRKIGDALGTSAKSVPA
jgi:DNA-binding MarR family transcriptional regulator